jgi:hypothetical protein
MTISTVDVPGAAPRTTLAGQITDQAELNGVLDTLYSLHLPIVTVETLDDES